MPVMSLPMYDWPEVRDATDVWARGIARHLGLDGVTLVRDADHEAPWRNPDLLLSQTCGYPFTHEYSGSLRLVATPHYDCDGCEGPRYRSFVFARGDGSIRAPQDCAGKRAAFNSRDSMSGMLALKLVVAPFAGRQRFFSGVIETGSHVGSLEAVARGSADLCAVDCVTVAYARRHRPTLVESLVEIARSPAVPALPYVTSAVTEKRQVERLHGALQAAVDDPGLAPARSALFIRGFSEPADVDYEEIPRLERALPANAMLDLW